MERKASKSTVMFTCDNLLSSCAGVDFFPISSNIGRCDCKNCLFISEKIVAEERKPGQILTIGDQVDLD